MRCEYPLSCRSDSTKSLICWAIMWRSPSTLRHCFSRFFFLFSSHNPYRDRSSLGPNALIEVSQIYKISKLFLPLSKESTTSMAPLHDCCSWTKKLSGAHWKLSHVEQCKKFKKMKWHSDSIELTEEENVCKPKPVTQMIGRDQLQLKAICDLSSALTSLHWCWITWMR